MIIDKGMSKVRFMAFLWPLYGLNMAFICFFLYYGFYMAYMAFGHRFGRRTRL